MATYGTAIKVGAAIAVANTGNPASAGYAVPAGNYARVYCYAFTTQNATASLAVLSYAFITINGVIYKYATSGFTAEVVATPSRISSPTTAGVTGTKLEFTGVTPGEPIFVAPGATIAVGCEFFGGGIESVFIDGVLYSNG